MKQQVMATGAQAMADGAGGAGGAGRAEFPGEPRVLTAEERARDRRLAEAKAERQRRRDERERLRVDVLLRAAEVLALLLFAGGMLFVVFFFPVLAHRTYFSENALLVNAAAPSYSAGDALIAQKMLERLQECHAPALLAPGGKKFASNEAVGMIMAAARDVGLQVETHAFDMHVSPHTLHRKFGRRGRYDTRPDYIRGTSVVALLRAPRGEGKEAVVLTAEYTDEDGEEHHVLEGEGSVAMLVSLMATLARVPWLSKDVIFLATPKSARRHEAVTSWLRDYHAYHMPMIRSGEIWAALALKLPDSGTFDTIGVAFEGEQGQYPNLDLVNVATSVIRGAGMLPVIPIDHYPLMREKHTRKVELRRARAHAEKLREARERAAHLPHGEVGSAEAEEPREFPPILSERGPKFLQLSTIWEQARTLFYDAEAYLLPKMVPSPNILQQVHTLRRSVVSQALGYSSGNHAAFKAFRVEAISLIAAPERVLALKTRTSGTEGNPGWSSHDIVRYGRTVEQMIHSCSNLLERFHQSFFLWVLIDEGHFLPPEKYLAPAGVLLLPLLVRAVVMWYAETTREKWRMAELSLVLLANVAGGTVLLAHELSGGGLMWQMLSTPIFVSYLYMSSYILPPSRDTQEKEREKAKKAKVPYARAPRRGAGPGQVDESYTFCWSIVRSQALVLQILFLATLCLTNYSFGLLSTMVIVPMTLSGFAPRSILVKLLSLASLIAVLSTLTIAIVFPESFAGGQPVGGGRCLHVLHSMVVLPAILLLSRELGEGLDEKDQRRYED